jgi:uncharacterized membrane protein YidH (DUF202 family)
MRTGIALVVAGLVIAMFGLMMRRLGTRPGYSLPTQRSPFLDARSRAAWVLGPAVIVIGGAVSVAGLVLMVANA